MAKNVSRRILGTKLTAKFDGSFGGEQLRGVKISKVEYNPDPPIRKPDGSRTNIVAVYFEMEFSPTKRRKRS